jgi:hypothetical protein
LSREIGIIRQAENKYWQAGKAAPDLEQLDKLRETVHIDKKTGWSDSG